MKSRIKVPLLTILTRDDAESMMNELALCIANQRKFITRRDAEVLAINRKYEANLAECDQAINLRSDALRAWAEANPDQFPKGRKSLQMTSGTLGFRTGTPKLALISRAWNWDKVLAALKAISPWRNYVRTKEEVDKESLLANASQAADKTAFGAELQRFGLRVAQDESFYIEPDLTDLESRQTPEAA